MPCWCYSATSHQMPKWCQKMLIKSLKIWSGSMIANFMFFKLLICKLFCYPINVSQRNWWNPYFQHENNNPMSLSILPCLFLLHSINFIDDICAHDIHILIILFMPLITITQPKDDITHGSQCFQLQPAPLPIIIQISNKFSFYAQKTDSLMPNSCSRIPGITSSSRFLDDVYKQMGA